MVSINDRYHIPEGGYPAMTTKTGKIFMHGRSQAVRLPKEFRLPGKEVRVRRDGNKLILEPIEPRDIDAWFAKLDAYRDEAGEEFMPKGREQPPMPDDDIDWDVEFSETDPK
jgi:antitoxin VapB